MKVIDGEGMIYGVRVTSEGRGIGGVRTAQIVFYEGEGAQRRSFTRHVCWVKERGWMAPNPDKVALARLDKAEGDECTAQRIRDGFLTLAAIKSAELSAFVKQMRADGWRAGVPAGLKAIAVPIMAGDPKVGVRAVKAAIKGYLADAETMLKSAQEAANAWRETIPRKIVYLEG